MAIGTISICNNALIILGARPIASFDDDSQQAAAVAAIYSDTLDEVLRAHPWNFAIRRAVLSPLAASPAFGYSYAFQRPSDWLRTLEVIPGDARHEGKQILCNSATLQLRYIARGDDATAYDSLFVAALVHCLASKLAYALTQSASLAEIQFKLYADKLRQARNVDAQEDPAEEFDESSLITVRR